MSGDRPLSRLVDIITDWLASERGFIQGLAVISVWLVLVFTGVDRHGWWLLFWLTVFSGITQYPLALKAHRAGLAAEKTARLHAQLLQNQMDTMKALVALANDIRSEQTEIVERLEELD